MICYYTETYFTEFGTWGGATSVQSTILDNSVWTDAANDLLEQMFGEREDLPSSSDINDYIWFDMVDDLWEYYNIDVFDEHSEEDDDKDDNH